VTDRRNTIVFKATERCYVKRFARLTKWFAIRMASPHLPMEKDEKISSDH
jgi:hypothetical protein